MKRIGVFGGSFDPYTRAHAAIVDMILKRDLVDEIVIIPTVVDWYREGKEKWLSPDQKLECISAFVRQSAFRDRITVDPYEFSLSTAEKANRRYVHMLAGLTCRRGIFDSYYTVIGTDSYAGVKKWWKWRAILELSDVICVNGRDGCDAEAVLPKLKDSDTFVSIDAGLVSVSASKIREKYGKIGYKAYLDSVEKGIS